MALLAETIDPALLQLGQLCDSININDEEVPDVLQSGVLETLFASLDATGEDEDALQSPGISLLQCCGSAQNLPTQNGTVGTCTANR